MNYISAGGSASFDALLYPDKSNYGIQYIADQFQNFSQSLTDVGRTFMNEAYDIYKSINDSSIVQMAKNALRKAGEFVMTQFIKPLYTKEELQEAPLCMQRWIMAEPYIRKEDQQGRLNGYKSTYMDLDPEGIGIDHYDYRRVTDGILMEDKDTGSMYIDSWYEDLYPDDRELDFDEQTDILYTWKIARMVMRNLEEDITCNDNNS